jgi:hypothetical protein
LAQQKVASDPATVARALALIDCAALAIQSRRDWFQRVVSGAVAR